MKKVILSAIAAVTVVGSAAANTTFSGPYIGAGLTYAKGKFDGKISNTVTNQSVSGGLSSSGAGVSTFLGYGHEFCSHFYIGGELSIGYDGSAKFNKKATGLGSTWEFKSRSKWTSSITGRLGYVFGNAALAYIKLGVEAR